MKYRATAGAWFSIFLENAFVSRVNRRIDIHEMRALDITAGAEESYARTQP